MTAKRGIMRALVSALAEGAPALGDNVYESHEEADKAARFPHLVFVAGKFEFMPWQEDPADSTDAPELDPSKALVNVGSFEGRGQVHVAATNRVERDTIEEGVFAAFFRREGSPGVLVVEAPSLLVGGVRTGYGALGAATLESDEWRDERVLAKVRYQFIDVALTVPMFVLRSDVHDLRQIVVAFRRAATGAVEYIAPANLYPAETFGTIPSLHSQGAT